jgi:hypothetical protein
MKQLIDEITDFIVKIEKAKVMPNEYKKLMMTWAELAEKAINAIKKNKEINHNDQLLIKATEQLLDIRLNYLKESKANQGFTP